MEKCLLLIIVLRFHLSAKCLVNSLSFPKEFKFGVATSAYQVEGGWNADGKGENILDRLVHEHPNYSVDHHNGDVACDSYNLWKRDIEILKYLKVDYYRFSLSWSRILPSGYSNYVNQHGVQYYNSLINELLKNDIEPLITLYHFDLPQPLQEIGGWPNQSLAKFFQDYAKIAFELFGDRVKTWITFNDPFTICKSAYATTPVFPPLQSLPVTGNYACGKTLLLAHAKTYHMYNKFFRDKQNGILGITLNAVWMEPKTKSINDIKAVERAQQFTFGWWMHPIYSKSGDYPKIMKDRIASLSKKENYSTSHLPELTKKQVKYIQGTSDFLGLNYYTSFLTSDKNTSVDAPVSFTKDLSVIFEQDPKWKSSSSSWVKDVPGDFRKMLKWIKKEYNNPPIYVTENGYADTGELNDVDRIDYFKGYLNALLEAIVLDKCDVKVYIAWSLMDNFEWNDGYTVKFGLYYVNFTDVGRTRTAKASATFYKTVIKNKLLPRGQ